MGFVILLIVILVVILLAFLGVFGEFPDTWSWVGILFALTSIIITAPSIFQMIFGRARVTKEYDIDAQELNRLLIIYLNNPPVTNRILKLIGVRRETVQSLTAEFQISEVGTNKIIAPIRHARLYSDDEQTDLGRDRILLPPTFSVSASMTIAYWDVESKNVKIMHDRLRLPETITSGLYRATIIFFVNGLPQKVTKVFCVGSKPDDLMWVKTN